MTPHQILQKMPQSPPFLFVDEIIDVDADTIVGKYRYKETEFFYQGHFPKQPITPGVILLETMAQVGVVAHAIYLQSLEGLDSDRYLTLFTDGTVEFLVPIYPRDEVIVCSKKMFLRHKKMRSKIEMFRSNILVASCVVSGMGVKS